MIYEVKQPAASDRVVSINHFGETQCVTHADGVLSLPAEFKDALQVLCDYLQLALDYIELFGGVPVPVAKAILRSAEPAHAAIDLTMKVTALKK